MKIIKIKITKWISFFLMLLSTTFLFTGCNDELEDTNGASLIEQYDLAGKWEIRITPKMMGMMPITSGIHEAELINEGNGVLRLKFSGFREPPMPFEMTVDVRMKVKPAPNGQLLVENIGGDFDANVPDGETINENDIPNGIEIPDGAALNGIHSNGASKITGKYEELADKNGKTTSMNFNWKLNPNVGLPVLINIRTLNKID